MSVVGPAGRFARRMPHHGGPGRDPVGGPTRPPAAGPQARTLQPEQRVQQVVYAGARALLSKASVLTVLSIYMPYFTNL